MPKRISKRMKPYDIDILDWIAEPLVCKQFENWGIHRSAWI